MNNIDLSVVVPAYAEGSRLGATLEALAKYLRTTPVISRLATEIIVVAADAPDNTKTVARQSADLFSNFRLVEPGPKIGKGRDVQAGMLAATGDAILFMDADMATPLNHILDFWERYRQGSQLVYATRNIYKHHPLLLRRLVSVCGNKLFKLLSGINTEDTQCGFKLFSNDAAQICFERLTVMGWGFDMEVLTIAAVNHLKIQAVRIDDWRDVAGGNFEQSVIMSSTRSLVDLVKIFFNRLFGRYKV